jgi:hypothetical protein
VRDVVTNSTTHRGAAELWPHDTAVFAAVGMSCDGASEAAGERAPTVPSTTDKG